MKCLVCSSQIDELRTFEGVEGPNGQHVDDLVGRFRHARELATWTQVSIVAQTPGGAQTVLSGHVCPIHTITDLVLTEKGTTS